MSMSIQRGGGGGGRRGGRGQGQGRGGHNTPNSVLFQTEMDVSYRSGGGGSASSKGLNQSGNGFGSRGGFVHRSAPREHQFQPQGQGVHGQYPGRSRNAIASSSSSSASSSTRIVITKEMEDEILALNNEYLHTQDPEFRCIMEKASQAAIYSYKLGDGEGWSDANAAGCLMLYERNVSPRVGFIILNRFAVPNWIHCFTPNQVEIQIQGKYLLFKSGSGIFCLWFYQDKDPEKFGEIMKRLGCKVAEDDHPKAGHSSGSYTNRGAR